MFKLFCLPIILLSVMFGLLCTRCDDVIFPIKEKAPEFPAEGLIKYQRYMIGAKKTFTNAIVFCSEDVENYYLIVNPNFMCFPGCLDSNYYREHGILVLGSSSGLKNGCLINIEGRVAISKEDHIPYLIEKSKGFVKESELDNNDFFYDLYIYLIKRNNPGDTL